MAFSVQEMKVLRFIYIVLFLMTVFPARAFSAPACDRLFELRQPSGVSFEARQFGDEWYNWVETKEGYGIYKNTETGNWEYYMPSADTNNKVQALSPGVPSRVIVGEINPALLGIPKCLRPPRSSVIKPNSIDSYPGGPSQKNLQLELKGTSVSGSKYVLIIGVDYADASATYPAGQIQPRLFGASDSVSDYYNKVSYSSVTIIPATESHGTSNDGFIGWLRLPGNHPNTGSSIDERNQRIAKEAILAADPYINYASYDFNNNGFVESTELSILIMVAGYEASYSILSPSVWAHQWSMIGVGYPFVDGKTIRRYAQFGERHGNHLATFGVIAHELGHLMFSLPDLYDTDASNGDSEGIGYFDLMGSGSWGAAFGADAGSSPTLLSAWSKEYLSWGTVSNLSINQFVSFPKADGNSTSIFRINTSDSNQYFLLENRQFTGYDTGFQRQTGLSGHGGLVIYHIDKLKTDLFGVNNVNADEDDKGVDVEEANEGSLGYSMLDTNSSRAHTNMFFFLGE
ncbi:MAG: M6 family metalloprotease domain-containing protein [Candidatus Brocadia sp.]